jgi:hypothetical protein
LPERHAESVLFPPYHKATFAHLICRHDQLELVGNVPLALMSDRELLAIAYGGSSVPVDDPNYQSIGGPSEPLRLAK